MRGSITFVINGLGAGGAEKNLTILANAFAERGLAVVIITFENKNPFFLLHPEISVRPLGLATKGLSLIHKFLRLPQIIYALRREIQKTNSDAIVSFMDQANIATIFATFGLGRRVIIAERINPFFSSLVEKGGPTARFFFLLRNFLYNCAHCVVVQTQGAAKCFSNLRTEVVVIPNPVVLPPHTPPDTKLQIPCILSIGRLVTQKRFDLVILAFLEIYRLRPDWHLSVVGSGPLEDTLHCLAKGCPNIHFIPQTSTPHALFREAEIVIQTSDYEGFPTVLLEAMSVGACVVATDCDFGPRDLIVSGKNGILVECNSMAAVVTALTQLMDNESERTRLGNAASEIIDVYPLERVVLSWLKLIHSTCSRTSFDG